MIDQGVHPATVPCPDCCGTRGTAVSCARCGGDRRVPSGRSIAIAALIRLHGPQRALELVREADALHPELLR